MSTFRTIAITFALAFVVALPLQSQPTTPSNGVYVIHISGEVDAAMAGYVGRAIDEARQAGARAIVFEINTFGGRVDAATEIRDTILHSSIPTLAWVNPRAISAGALIALACEKIVMAPGALMGATTPVDGRGVRASEKIVSYMRAEMRATAERRGRNPNIAEAMVDEKSNTGDSILGEAGRLVTLSTTQAMKLGYGDAEATTIDDALRNVGFESGPIVETDLVWGELLIRILTLPIVSAFLIMFGLAGIFYTVKSGHVSAFSGIGVMSIALFFGAQFVSDLATYVEIVMFAAGVILLIAEIFVIPGFGVAGISGILLIVGSLFLALVGSIDLLSSERLTSALYTLAGSFVGLALLGWGMIRYLPRSSAFDKVVLWTTQSASDGYVSSPNDIGLLGLTGVSVTTLRPAGVATLGDIRYDVITEGEFIPAGEELHVVRVEGRRIVVRRS